MPVSSMALLRPIVERAIAQIIPDVLPALAFRRASADCHIRHQTFGDREDGCRRFQVIQGPLGGLQGAQVAGWNGDALELQDNLEVWIRYALATADDQFGTLCDMVSTDQQIIIRQIHPLLTDYADAIVHNITPTGSVQAEPIVPDDPNVSAWLFRIQFALSTSLGDD